MFCVRVCACACVRAVARPQGTELTRAIRRDEVVARLGDQACEVKTLDNTHLYCEPPDAQPSSLTEHQELPSLRVSSHFTALIETTD